MADFTWRIDDSPEVVTGKHTEAILITRSEQGVDIRGDVSELGKLSMGESFCRMLLKQGLLDHCVKYARLSQHASRYSERYVESPKEWEP